HGSIALEAFEEGESDIDIVALTTGEWAPDELARFASMHKQLLQEDARSSHFDVAYIPFQEKQNGQTSLSAIFRDGKFITSTSGAHMDATMQWIIKHQGICLLGPQPSELPFEVTWNDVLTAMQYNLDGYWAGKAKRPYLFLFDYWVMTATATLCRILTAIEEGEIIAKSPALLRWRDRLPQRWQVLLDEAWRIRHHLSKPSLCRNRLQRMRETLAFLAYVRARGKQALKVSHFL
ncbi:MAG TPA: aminoglycoside adenylyltransferase domain-containing protein, partial [Ktedonobacteraceae bacterium]|nr:aminoglycoside adenylyltransferase domain-containing protein [Ktedonobacteraceae bacterium]